VSVWPAYLFRDFSEFRRTGSVLLLLSVCTQCCRCGCYLTRSKSPIEVKRSKRWRLESQTVLTWKRQHIHIYTNSHNKCFYSSHYWLLCPNIPFIVLDAGVKGLQCARAVPWTGWEETAVLRRSLLIPTAKMCPYFCMCVSSFSFFFLLLPTFNRIIGVG
jgi:hypothetical protein